MNKSRFLSAFLATLLVCVLPAAVFSGCAHTHAYEETVIRPTCTSIGYTVHACPCGDVYYSDYQAKTPHVYEGWTVTKEADAIYGGEARSVCATCGSMLFREIPCQSKLTRILLTQRSGEPVYDVSYESEAHRFESFAELSVRNGDDEKPDYVLAFQTGAGNPFEIDLGWGSTSVYCLNGYAKEPSRLREPAASAAWSLLTSSESAFSAGGPYLPDGALPVQFYMNGVYRGLYLLTVPAGYADVPARTAFIQNGSGTGCLFKTDPVRYEDAGDGSGFSFLSSPSAASDADKAWTSFSRFHAFVRESSDEQFASHLKDYADVNELIDAFLFADLLFVGDAGESDVIWFTDDGKHWRADFLSMSMSLGIYSSGSIVSPGFRLLAHSGESVTYIGNHRLWERLVTLYPAKLAERYELLRKTITPERLTGMFASLYDSIPAQVSEGEETLFPSSSYRPGREEVETFVKARFEIMDSVFAKQKQES